MQLVGEGNLMRILQVLFGNWCSRAYLIIVALVGSFVTLSYANWDQPDANLAGVWLVFATLPFSLFGTLAADPAAGTCLLVAAVAMGAMINATVIGLVANRNRRSARRRADAVR